LGAEQYAAYALACSTFLLVSLIYQALLLEPMSVFGSSTYRGSVRQYLGGLLWLQAAIAAVFVALGTTASVVHYNGRPALQFAFIGMTFAAPCVLLFWFARRAFYLQLLPGRALGGAILYTALLLTGVCVLLRGARRSRFLVAVAAGTSPVVSDTLHSTASDRSVGSPSASTPVTAVGFCGHGNRRAVDEHAPAHPVATLMEVAWKQSGLGGSLRAAL